MTVIKMGYRDNYEISRIAVWLNDRTGGARYAGSDQWSGPGWKIYPTTEMRMPKEGPNPLPYLITKVEIEDPQIVVLFKLRWQ